MTQPDPSELTAVCYVRAPLLLEPVDSKVQTLRTAAREGQLGDLLFRSWSDSVSLAPESPHEEVTERFEEFEAWAEENEVSIRPPFRIRSSTSLAAAEPTRVLVTPILCLALYADRELIGVYPHSHADSEETYTTTDAIATLRTGELPVPLGAREPPTPTPGMDATTEGEEATADTETETEAKAESEAKVETETQTDTREITTPTLTACPSCDADLLNVQGILACTGCEWTDSCFGEIDSSNAKLVYLSVLEQPVTVETLQRTLNLSKIDILGVLQTLSARDLVERTDEGAYRAIEPKTAASAAQ